MVCKVMVCAEVVVCEVMVCEEVVMVRVWWWLVCVLARPFMRGHATPDQEYTLGLLHFLRTDPSVNPALQRDLAAWGTGENVHSYTQIYT